MKNLMALLFVFGMTGTVYADQHMDMKEMTKEQRVKMADMHDKMAACLRSDRAMKDCHDEMKMSCDADKDCKEMMMHHMDGDHKKVMKKDK